MTTVDTLHPDNAPVATAPSATVRANSAEQLVYVKAVRAFAMLFIVTLHVAFPLIYLYNSINYADWWSATGFYMVGKIGSPLFTMVSGLLLLNPGKEQPISVFFRKRFVKVLFPFIAWAVLYIGWRVFFWNEAMTPRDMLRAVVEGPVYYHMWFIQMILGLYLATPILRVYTRHASQQNLTYFVAVWFITAAVLPIFQRFTGIAVGIDIVVTTEFVGYFVLGHYLRNVELTKKQVVPVLVILVAALLFTHGATYAMTVGLDGTFDNFFVLNTSANIVIIGVSLFLLLKSLDYDRLFQRLPPLRVFVMAVSSCSLGIYFVHVMVIELLGSGRLGFVIDANTLPPVIGIPLVGVLVITLSAALVSLLKKIPLVRQIVP